MKQQQQQISENSSMKKWSIMLSLLMSGFIGLFSETALNMAFTNIMEEYQIGASSVQWLTTGYLLTLGIFLPVTALLIQWFSTRQLFLTSILLSITGTLIGALAPSFSVLLLARIVQALGTGLLLPLMTNIILLIFPIHKRGAAMGVMGLVILSAPAVGPTFAGFLVETLSWKFIFWTCFILLFIPLLFGMKYIQNITTITRPKIDVLSIVLSSIGFGGIVFGFSSAGGGLDAWLQPTVLISIGIGIISLALFIFRQLKLEKPMLNIRIFQFPMFTLGVILVFICMFSILGSGILLPLYLKNGLLYSAFVAGLILLPGGVINGLMSMVSGKLFDRFGPKFLVIPGTFFLSIMAFLFTNVSITTPAWTIILMHSLFFVCISLIIMPAQTNGLNQLPKQFYPDGTAIINTLQQIAGAIGTALAISFMSAGQAKYIAANGPDDLAGALVAGVQTAFYFVFGMTVLAFIAALFIKRVSVKR